jgi:hypothetical protein
MSVSDMQSSTIAESLTKKILIRLAALLAATFVFLIAVVIIEIGSDVFSYELHSVVALAAKENYPLVVDYHRVGLVFHWGYPAATALAVAFFFWRGWPREWARIILYVLLLLLIGPLTYINYLFSDQWLNLWIQAVFNAFVAFVGYTIVLKIRGQTTRAADASALRSLAILALTSLMIALPLFYTAIFLAVEFHLLDHHQVDAINEKVPLIFAGGVGAIAVLLSNLERLREPQMPAKADVSAKMED